MITGIVVALLLAVIVFQYMIIKIDKDKRHEAGHDKLTGLCNPEHLMQKMKELPDKKKNRLIIYSDIAEFKLINEIFGIEKGNEILLKQADIIKKHAVRSQKRRGRMKLLFKQRMFSWFDSYDIYDENENTVYVVKGQLSWGHCLKIFDTEENELGTVKQEVLTWLPKFELYEGENYIGCLEKELGWFKPKYNIDFNGWHVEGDFPGWDYTITKPVGETVATVSKELLQWTDTYVLDIVDPADALYVLMFVLAIDAEKCSAK